MSCLLFRTTNCPVYHLGQQSVLITKLIKVVPPLTDRVLPYRRQVNLLNHFQREVTSYWLRFNERTVEDMINATFDLLTLGYDRPLQLSPTHFLCLVDPVAQWFRKWTVSEGLQSFIQRVGGAWNSLASIFHPQKT